MTEIPEHLLKRSRERRAALGLSSDEGAGDAPADPRRRCSGRVGCGRARRGLDPRGPSPPAPPAVVAPPPPPPPEYVQAAMRRKRIPYWALPVVALLPLWAFIYQWSLTPPSATISGPLAEGEEIYTANCASCHLPTGAGNSAGGIGQQLSNGEVLLTFPDIADQISFVMTGSDPYIGKPYGDPDRPGGPRIGKAGMPPWEDILTAEEINAVVCYERVVLSGENPVPPGCTTEGAAEAGTETASGG